MHLQMITFVSIFIVWHCSVSASSYTHYRLPTAIKPDLYELKVITHLEDPSNLTFTGQVTIRFKVMEETSNITLHVRNLTVDDSRIKLKNWNASSNIFHLCKKGIETVPQHDYYIIQLCKPLRKGEMYTLRLVFSGVLSDGLHGYYLSTYYDKAANETRRLAVTHFEPVHARSAFPCLDEPQYKAKFKIWLGHHKALSALSNMPLEKQVPLPRIDNFIWSVFQESVIMSTYLVAYSVNDFSYKLSQPIEGSNVQFRTWSHNGTAHQCDYAAEAGPKVLKFYEDTFGIPFPLSKVDDIAIPDMAPAAMENWGLITYDETALLLDPNTSTISDKQYVATTIAHELAHQWFGNLVTMEWWNDVWLNEGFATYIASLGIQHLLPAWDLYNREAFVTLTTVWLVDAKPSSHPISQPIESPSEANQIFDSIAYKKGSAILRMLHLFLGSEGFFGGIRDYLERHKYQNAQQDDLWAALTAKARDYTLIRNHYDLKTIMDSWTLQSGYPWVIVQRDYKSNSIEIRQQRYLRDTDLMDEQADRCWWIPLSYTTASEMDFNATKPKAWLECDADGRSITLQLDNVAKEDEWVLFNVQLGGVYRVLYDRENWRLLKVALNSENFTKIHPMNRAQLIMDALDYAWNGHQDYDVALDVLDYLRQERDFLPWASVHNNIHKVENMLKHSEELYGYFKAYMRRIFEPFYTELHGLNETDSVSSNTYTHILLKTVLASWACRVEIEDCVTSAVNSFQKWKASKNPNTENQIPADLKTTVYCTAIRHGSTDDWEFLWQRYKATNVETEKDTILYALSCSSSKELLGNLIDMAFGKGEEHIPKQDAYAVFGYLSLEQAPMARDYFIKHFDEIQEYIGTDALPLKDMFSNVASQAATAKDLEQLYHLIDGHKEFYLKFKTSIDAHMEIAKIKIKWIEDKVEDLGIQLKSHLYHMDKTDDFDSEENF